MKAMHSRSACQAGAATLAVVALLLLLMLAAALLASRNLVADQRSAAHQVHHVQAMEAAEAGLQWALARLNGGALDPLCRPAAGLPWRDEVLPFDAGSGRFVPAPAAPVAACAHDGMAWHCACGHGPEGASVPARGAAAPHAAFVLRLQPLPRPGQVRVVARGCSGRAASCDGAPSESDAQAEVSLVAALLPALRSPPAAALAARGAVDLGGSPLNLVNAGAGTVAPGLALQAGGNITGADAARFTTAAGGAPTEGARFANDPALAGLATERFFASVLGPDRAGFLRLPGLHRLACGGDCSAALARAHAGGARLVWVDEALRLQGPAQLGTPDQPLLVVAAGEVSLSGPVQLHGALYGAAPRWRFEPEAGSVVRGAVIAEGDVALGAAAAGSVVYDAAIVGALQRRIGTLVAVPGGWSDLP
jgi:hypothetical protein